MSGTRTLGKRASSYEASSMCRKVLKLSLKLQLDATKGGVSCIHNHFFIQVREEKTLWKNQSQRIIIVCGRSERKRLITTCCGLILHTCRKAKRDAKNSLVNKGNIIYTLPQNYHEQQRLYQKMNDAYIYIGHMVGKAHAPMSFLFNTMTLFTFL